MAMCICGTCRQAFSIPDWELRMRRKNNKTAALFCSNVCYGRTYRGARHPNIRGKRVGTKGYVLLEYKKREHAAIAERALGRELKVGEVVHHINGDKADNRSCNLLICSQSYHAWLHQEMAQRYMLEHFKGV